MSTLHDQHEVPAALASRVSLYRRNMGTYKDFPVIWSRGFCSNRFREREVMQKADFNLRVK